MLLFSIQDQKAAAFNRPFCSQTRATAMREIAVGLKQDSAMAQFASDYSLFEVGSFDIEKGILLPSAVPDHVCEIKELLELNASD